MRAASPGAARAFANQGRPTVRSNISQRSPGVGQRRRSRRRPPRPPGSTRTDLQRHDLSIPGREVLQARVDFAPGASFPAHRHPGEEIIYVLAGTLEYELEGQPPVTLEAGRRPVRPRRGCSIRRGISAPRRGANSPLTWWKRASRSPSSPNERPREGPGHERYRNAPVRPHPADRRAVRARWRPT